MQRRTPKIYTPEEACTRLEELCVRSEQCVGDLRQKLYRWKIAAEDVERIIGRLVDRRFVDDRRFAAAYVRDKYRFNGWGRRRIILELRRKSVNGDIIADALTNIDEGEYLDILTRLLRQRTARMEWPLSYADRTAVYRFALGRGYEPELITAALKHLGSAG